MSQKSTYQINCPQCGQMQDVELFDAINVSEHPDLRQKLMTNQLQMVTCEYCEFQFSVDKPLLYHDTDNHFMIYWIPSGENTPPEKCKETFENSLQEILKLLPTDFDPPQIHLVLTRTELVERIFMLESELDERIIEYIKYQIYTRNLEKIAPEQKILLFNAEDSSAENLCFVVQDATSRQFESVLEYSREAYAALSEMFDRDEQTGNLFEFFPGPYINARALLLKEMNSKAKDQSES
jgi:transcription elongation factor Elf1